MISCIICYFGFSSILNNDIYFNDTQINILLKKHAINNIIHCYKKYKLRKNLILYSNSLINLYYHPKSKYINYLVYNFDNKMINNKKMGYINKNNKLIFFNFII
jgi:hypothetical protein